jgi:2-keto-4-pentenoate hydratase/2-oxohepta-3-ene-1,7-dioic acid hydratase in catechol pathway
MKLGNIIHKNKPTLIVQTADNRAITLKGAYKAAGLDRVPKTMLELIRGGRPELKRLRKALAAGRKRAKQIDLSGAEWLPPQPDPRKILGVAFNNVGIRRAAHVDPGVPNFFLKSASCLTGHNKPIVIRQYFGQTIPEPELCLVIGKGGKDIPEGDALAHVFGYSIIDDVTSHGMKFSMDSVAVTREPELMRPEYINWRRRHGGDDHDLYYVYHTRSKSSDTFGPMGPWLTTADEIPDPNNVRIRAYRDGELFSDDSTAKYTFKIETLIAEASRFFTLEPGDIISCGTAAKGNERFPHAHRDVALQLEECTIDIELDGLGRLSNPVYHEWKHQD